MNAQVTPQRTLPSFTFDYASLEFVIKQLIGKIITIVPCRVTAVTGAGSLTSCPYVNVQPLLQQRTGASVGVDHGIVYNVPVWRFQTGSTAIVADPTDGDVGVLLVAYRDTAALRAADQQSPGSLQNGGSTYLVGSKAQYDWGSAFYLGGFLNGAVSQYIQLTASLCKIHFPTINLNGVTIDSSGNLVAHSLEASNGASGTFTSQDGKTVTVVDGIITAIV